MTETIIKEVATKFLLSEEEVVTEGLRAFLHRQLQTYESERQHLFAKHSVNDFDDLDAYVAAHPNQETNLLPDLQRADYLTKQVNDVRKLLVELNGDD